MLENHVCVARNGIDAPPPGAGAATEPVLLVQAARARQHVAGNPPLQIHARLASGLANMDTCINLGKQVATLRESNADYRKFYVHSGTSTLTLRAESKEDRWVWMQALQTRWAGRATCL